MNCIGARNVDRRIGKEQICGSLAEFPGCWDRVGKRQNHDGMAFGDGRVSGHRPVRTPTDDDAETCCTRGHILRRLPCFGDRHGALWLWRRHYCSCKKDNRNDERMWIVGKTRSVGAGQAKLGFCGLALSQEKAEWCPGNQSSCQSRSETSVALQPGKGNGRRWLDEQQAWC